MFNIKFSINDRVKIVALISSYTNATGVIRNVIAPEHGEIPSYLVKLDNLQEEILFDQWELRKIEDESTTQS